MISSKVRHNHVRKRLFVNTHSFGYHFRIFYRIWHVIFIYLLHFQFFFVVQMPKLLNRVSLFGHKIKYVGVGGDSTFYKHWVFEIEPRLGRRREVGLKYSCILNITRAVFCRHVQCIYIYTRPLSIKEDWGPLGKNSIFFNSKHCINILQRLS